MVWVAGGCLFCLGVGTRQHSKRRERSVTSVHVLKYNFGNEDEVVVFSFVWTNMW